MIIAIPILLLFALAVSIPGALTLLAIGATAVWLWSAIRGELGTAALTGLLVVGAAAWLLHLV